MNNKKTIVLVGSRPTWCENLSIGYLKTASENAGFEVSVQPLNTAKDISKVASRIIEIAPLLVGFSICGSSSAILSTTLGEMLRKRSYTGHITCGGGFATLARQWLLGRYQWLDSVVRFNGETVLPQLARSLSSNNNPNPIAGLTTKLGDGLPADVLDNTPFQIWPSRDHLTKFLGHNAALISGSRGCEGKCEYCGPVSLQTLEKKEGQRGGATAAQLKQCKIGGLRRRDVNNLCDEMAHLWHKRDVRFFGFSDEHLLPHNEKTALEFISTLKQGLTKRGVSNFGFSGQLRATDVTKKLADKLADAGMIRAHIGLDLGSDAGYFSRSTINAEQILAVKHLNDQSVTTISSIMLIHPYSTIDSIKQALALAREMSPGIVDYSQMLVFEGTRLKQRLEREGRLSGNPLKYDYSFNDKTIKNFARIFARLRITAFGEFSILQRIHESISFNILATNLKLSYDLDKHKTELEKLRQTACSLCNSAYEQALVLAQKNDLNGEDKALVAAYKRGALLIEAKLSMLDNALESKIKLDFKQTGTFRNAAVSLVTFIAAAAATSCYNASPIDEQDSTLHSDNTDDTNTDSDTNFDPECTPEDIQNSKDELVNITTDADPCFSGWISNSDGDLNATFGIETSTWPSLPCPDSSYVHKIESNMQQHLNDSMNDPELQCLPSPYEIYIEGLVSQELRDITDAVVETCDLYNLDIGDAEIKIHVNSNGTIADITVDPNMKEYLQDTVDCMKSALDGLVFPCLADTDICMQNMSILMIC